MQRILQLTLIFNLLILSFLNGQSVWPGDINESGNVNAVDLLYYGVAKGEVGPPRDLVSTLWQSHTINQLWTTSFSNNVNYATADCDGNGVVSIDDLEFALKSNNGLVHSVNNTVSEGYLEGVEGTDPPIILTPSTDMVYEGDTLQISLDLGSLTLPVNDFYGMAVYVSYSSHLVESNSDIVFTKSGSTWIDPTGNDTRMMIRNDDASGILDFGITRTNHINIPTGEGTIGAFDITIEDIVVTPYDVDTLRFTVDSVIVIDNNFQTMAIALPNSAEASVFVMKGGRSPVSCPKVVDPVVTLKGETYLNSCFAEHAGYFQYVSGTGFGDCIDATEINFDDLADCGEIYAPVCGCNNVTYKNECEADASGVQNYIPGQCPTSSDCFDLDYILASGNCKYYELTGLMATACDDVVEPVCGCNGITYQNACNAEASGVIFYTSGNCADVCIDPNLMNPNAINNNVYDPVCGCNNVTYSNAGFAQSAGVVNYTNGACGANLVTSSWCDKAELIQCGDFFAYETTNGAGNDIENYPSCAPNDWFAGADKVYVITKTTAGDLQIGLEILTPNVDLDLFLLRGDCSTVSCLKKSVTDNKYSNNEGIVLEDAPLGTYYIVVDAQYANVVGDFRIEVNCGYLDCSSAVQLSCGTTFNGTNANGQDNVSLYSCSGNVQNVENNGPEVVHTFTTTSTGNVDIELSMWNANLELFLLNSCGQDGCIDFSSQPGSTTERITTYLPAGTYYVVVDGYNGAVGEYALTVNCNSSCNMNLSLSSTQSNCGQNTGKIQVTSSGGTPSYIVSWTGPVSGNLSTASNICTIRDLPSGVYTVKKTDVNGCSKTKSISVADGGGFTYTYTPHSAICNSKGSISIQTNGGTPPFRAWLTGALTAVTNPAYTNNFTIIGLDAGTYSVKIVDKYGCSDTHVITIDQENNNFDFIATPYDAACGQLGSIRIKPINGIPKYTINISGPVSGTATSSDSEFLVPNLPAGIYQITLEDGNWCSQTKTVVIGSSDLSFTAIPQSGICAQKGSISVNINSGSPAYRITWTGPNSGNTTISNNAYTIQNLSPGSYTVRVTDENNCTHYRVVTINNSALNLMTTATPIPGNCGIGSIWIDLNNGTAPYTITWTGASPGTATTSNNGYDIQNVIAGNYWISITDANGCMSSHDVVLIGNASSLNVSASVFNGGCGTNGKIVVHTREGDAPYSISWNGPSVSSVVTSLIDYPINNLVSGTYGITVTDANGCQDITTATVDNSTASTVLFTATPVAGTCGGNGRIGIDFISGQAPYNISWSGPSGGSAISQATWFDINNLISGTYSILVTDDTGCAYSKSVTVANATSIVDFTLTTIPGNCGSTGQIGVDITSGSPTFTIAWSGPSSGTRNTSTNWYNITSLSSGIYEVTVTDITGCSLTKTITLNNTASDITFVQGAAPGSCGHNGIIWVDVKTGQPDFTLEWSGPQSGSITQTSPWFDITNLISGTYTIKITDNTGCYVIKQITLNNTDEQLSVVATPTNGSCGENGSIWLDITGGTTPFTINWSGPVSGTSTTNSYSHDISDLKSGNYSLTVTDKNGCSATQSLSIYNTNTFTINTTSNSGTCSSEGSILVSMNLGSPNYSIVWSGASSGAIIVDQNNYLIPNLPQGNYSVVVTDGNGCSATSTSSVSSVNSNLSIATTITNVKCNAKGSIWIDIANGTPDFIIEWSGQSSGTTTISGQSWDINNLDAGNYTVKVTDANGCYVIKSVTIGMDSSNLDFTTNTTDISCGISGSIELNITNGNPYYTVSWTGPQTGTTTVNDANFTLSNLIAGSYTITVQDVSGCSIYKVVEVLNQGGGLNVDFTLTDSNCGVAGSIWLSFTNGNAPYSISWSGTATGTATTNDAFYDITNLFIGNYSVTVTDANGCNIVQSVTLEGSPALNVTTTSTNGSCENSNGVIYITMNNGNPNYSVSWSGPQSGTSVVSGNSFTLNNLPNGTYQLTVIDALNCSSYSTETIDNTSGLPTSSFDYTSEAYTATFTNTGSTGTYTWNFGDGSQFSNDANPVHEYQEAGTYQVCLKVENSCGYTSSCQDVVISVSSAYVVLDIGEVSGPSNTVVQVPVTVNNCDLLVSLAGSLEVSDPTIGEIVGVTAGVISPQYFSVNSTFNYYANNGQGIVINDNDILFYINVKLIGNAGLSTIVKFVNTPLPVEVGSMINGVVTAIPHVTSTGVASIPMETSLAGKVTTYWGEGIKDVNILLNGQGFLMNQMTDQNGFFNLPNLPTGNVVEVSAEKDIADENGLSTFALFAGQRFILGLDPDEITSPYQVIAGDADCSGSFSTIDLFVIQQLIIGTNDAFSACPSWVFVSEHNTMPTDFDAYNVFPYASSEEMMAGEQTTMDFVGVKVGDILGHANPNGFVGEIDDRYAEDIRINISDRSAKEGDEIEIEFTSDNFEQLVSFQGNLTFNTNKLSYLGRELSPVPSLKSIAIGTKDEGNLRISWFSLSGRGIDYAGGNYIFKLKFLVNEDFDNLEDIFEFNNRGIKTVAYDENIEAKNLVIHVLEHTTTATNDIDKGYTLFQNIPNPFLDYTLIQFELPEQMEASITIRNNIGQIVKNVKGTFNKGIQSIRVDKKDLGTGVFYYSLETDSYNKTKKMVAVD